MADILFVHNTFPGRFEFLLKPLLDAGHRLSAIAGYGSAGDDRVAFRRYRPAKPSTPGIFVPALRAEADLVRGRGAAEQALAMRAVGYSPDLIVAHPGWGEGLFLSEIWPQARQVLVGEFWYRTKGADIGFDPEFEAGTMDEQFRVHAKNMGSAMAAMDADLIVCPTPFQARLHPEVLAPIIRVIHEGVDTAKASPRNPAVLTLGSGVQLGAAVGAPFITFVNRRFEPLRGFHILMRALPAFLEANPEAHVLMIGDDSHAGYGPTPKDGRNWRQVLTAEVGERLPAGRVHFVGTLPYEQLLMALSNGAAHVHYSYPFVLSWSLVDAMACEALILGSDTAPLRDAVEDGVNGRLLNFFDTDALAHAMTEAVREPERFQAMRKAARRTAVERFDRDRTCLPAWLELIDEVLAMGPKRPPWREDLSG